MDAYNKLSNLRQHKLFFLQLHFLEVHNESYRGEIKVLSGLNFLLEPLRNAVSLPFPSFRSFLLSLSLLNLKGINSESYHILF